MNSALERLRAGLWLALCLALPGAAAAGTTAIVGGAVVDLEGKAPLKGAVILVEDERIVAIGKAGSVEVPEDADIIDAGGAWLIPGLMNMHVHLGPILPGKMMAELALNRGSCMERISSTKSKFSL